MDTREQIKAVRNAIKKIAPTVSVRRGRGTARGWIEITGSADSHGAFTETERESLKQIGLVPGGNLCLISPDERRYWAEKLSA
ncbi:MAG TPA: hypothetical protein VIK33_16245 [Anaerolineae bacterium]